MKENQEVAGLYTIAAIQPKNRRATHLRRRNSPMTRPLLRVYNEIIIKRSVCHKYSQISHDFQQFILTKGLKTYA